MRNITHIWMWTEACARIDQAESLQRTFFRPGDARSAQPIWEPPADIFESPSEILIIMALPGVAANCVTVATQGSNLTVVSERRLPELDGDQAIRCLEMPYGRFERQFELPTAALDLVEQKLTDGCLTIRLRKRK